MEVSEERKSGLRSLLSTSLVYDLFQSVIGGKRARKYVVHNYINNKLKNGSNVLDIGCGTGYVLDYFGTEVNYIGYDLDETYIEYANKKYQGKGKFYCQRVKEMNLAEKDKFDFVMAMGLLHHLNDQESIELFGIAHSVLKEGGHFLTLDGVFTDEQSTASKYILNNDRGKHVRYLNEYKKLASNYFSNVDSEISDEIFRIPYTACILDCQK